MQLNYRKLRLQRNILGIVILCLIISNTILTLKLHSIQTITRLVPTLSAEQIISEDYANDEALRVRAREVMWLLFSMKKENVDINSAALLRLVDNACIDSFKKQIESLASDISTKNYRYVFTEQGYEFDNHKFTVRIKGNLETYMAGKQLLEISREYLITFLNRGGVLTVKSFEEVNDENNENNKN